MGKYIGTTPTYGVFDKQILVPNSVDNLFLLNFQTPTPNSLLVVYGGVVQQPGDSYALAGGGTEIEFSFIPITGQDLYIIYLGKELAVAPEAVISNAFVDEELPIGAINGINTSYQTANDYISSSLKIYYNGIRLTGNTGNFISTGLHTFSLSFAPQTGDILVVDYRKL